MWVAKGDTRNDEQENDVSRAERRKKTSGTRVVSCADALRARGEEDCVTSPKSVLKTSRNDSLSWHIAQSRYHCGILLVAHCTDICFMMITLNLYLFVYLFTLPTPWTDNKWLGLKPCNRLNVAFICYLTILLVIPPLNSYSSRQSENSRIVTWQQGSFTCILNLIKNKGYFSLKIPSRLKKKNTLKFEKQKPLKKKT